MGNMSLTKQLAANAAAYRYTDMPEDVRQMARLALLDNLGCALRGLSEPLSQILAAEYFDRANGVDPDYLLSGGDGAAAAADFAIFFGSTSHAIDFDDSLPVAGGHMGTVVIGAVMALAARLEADTDQVLAAIVAGYETGARIGAVYSVDAYHRGFHSTATVGVMAAAAAIGNLMQLNPQEIENAIGLAATQAGGLKVSFGTMAKPFNAGHAAGSGVRAARLAARGFEASQQAVEGEFGVLSAFGRDPEAGPTPPMDKYLILTNIFKFHAACHFTHVAIDGMAALRDRLDLTPDLVEAVEVTVAPVALKTARILSPQSGLECKFSFPFTLAAVLNRLDMADDASYTDALARDRKMTDLCSRISVTTDETLAAATFKAKLAVTLKDATKIDETFDLSDTIPGLDRQADLLLDKFVANCSRLFAPEAARHLGNSIYAADPGTRFAPAHALPREAAE